MIERFDHAVIGVPDLPSAMATFEGLGFVVSEGGRHPSLGTRNAIVRFGLDYLELLTVEYPDLAVARGPFGADLVAFLERSSGLVGYVLAGTGLRREATRLGELGIPSEGPFDMDRVRPDGRRLEWRLVLPGPSPWRNPLPYLIDWVTDQRDLLAWDPPREHPCGVTAVAGIDLLVDDLENTARLYDHGLGLADRRDDAGGQARTSSLRYRLGEFRLGIRRPDPGEAMAAELERTGPGPYRLTLSSPDMQATAASLRSRAVPFAEIPDRIDLDPDIVGGVRLRIVPG